MKKVLLTLLTLLTLKSGLCMAEFNNAVEFRSSAYLHTSDAFKDVYGEVGPTFGLEATNKFSCFDVFANLDYFSKHSRHNEYGRSRIELVTGSAGIKYHINLCSFLKPYIGVGPSATCINLKESSFGCKTKTTKIAFGVVAKSGLIVELGDFYYVNFFADYLYQPVRLRKTIDISGLKAGIGLGINF